MERTYIIPLRKELLKKPRHVRAKKAVTSVKAFIGRHMKVEPKQLLMGSQLNLALWKHGIKNPPTKVKVTAKKDKDGQVTVELFGHEYLDKKKEKKQEPKQETAIDRIKKMAGPKESRAAKAKREREEEESEKKTAEVKDALKGSEQKEKNASSEQKETKASPSPKETEKSTKKTVVENKPAQAPTKKESSSSPKKTPEKKPATSSEKDTSQK